MFVRSLVCVVGLILCALMRYIGFMGVLFFMPNWMFEHDWTPTVLGCLICMHFLFCICTCSVQLSMFHMERHSKNTLIIIIITFWADLKLEQCKTKQPSKDKKH